MKIVIPIRSSESQLNFPDYLKYKTDLKNLTEKEKLINLLNIESDYIIDISFEICERNKIREDEFYIELFDFENLRVVEEDFLIIDLKTIHKEENIDKDMKFILKLIVERVLNTYLFLINLTYEFSVDFLSGYILNENNEILGKTEIAFSRTEYAYESILKLNWPKIDTLEFSQTLEWFTEHNIKFDNVSNSKAGRAINAFSQMFGKITEPDSSLLFWTMLGIEALLAEGNSNITSQIKTKCILLFGEPNEFKKKLNQLYDYRSRFVHGDINIPPKFFYYNDDFEYEYWDQLNFSVSILLALIRKLIVGNKTQFKFEYKYCG